MNSLPIDPADAPSHEPDTVRAYVNERGVSVKRGATALDVVRAFDAAAAEAVEAGTQRLTDSRGLPIDAHSAAHGGAIYRLLPVRAMSLDATEEGA
jgi:hypothetical protein